MTAPFVSQLRARSEPIQVGPKGADVLHLRVQMPEVWDAVGVQASPTETVASVKRAALEALAGAADNAGAYVVKLRGFEVLDENATLAEAGAEDGSTFLLMNRRRRPVR
jgi:hypothetical protein